MAAPLARHGLVPPLADPGQKFGIGLAPFRLQARDDGSLRRNARFGQTLQGNVAVADRAGQLHHLAQLRSNALPGLVRIVEREGAETAAEAADGHAQIVDGIGIAGLRRESQTAGEVSEERFGLLPGIFPHIRRAL